MAADKIIISIGITRIICLLSYPLHFFSYICSAELHILSFMLTIITAIPAGFSSIWLSNLLSIFFCFKISNFHNAFFLHLKAIISQKVNYLIIASVVLSFGYTLTFILVQSNTFFKHLSYSDLLYDYENLQLIFSFNCLWNIFLFLTFFASLVLLFIFLSFHIRQMKNHGNGIRSTHIYYKMMIFTAVSFLICISCSIVNLTEWYGMKLFGIAWMYILWNIFPVLHSVSLIYVTAKLNKEFFRILNCGIDFLFRRKTSKADK
uniref:Taste receptor type 2 n=1 Tax=Pyxicephalus adspersus TaxID=30357 RepID=A0AAV3AS59_PYXAD|nr:TPA: hypothetical protein GDO54_009887 [Pyxicephalus adspersus]